MAGAENYQCGETGDEKDDIRQHIPEILGEIHDGEYHARDQMQ